MRHPNKTSSLRFCAKAISGLLLLVLIVVSCEPGQAGQSFRFTAPNIYVVVVDGGGTTLGSPSKMPELWQRLNSEQRGRFYRRGLACMPSVTNTNHVSMVTGVYPAAHGITGDAFWNRETQRPIPMDDPSLIEVDTIFSRLNDLPGRISAALFGKSKLAMLFAGGTGNSAPSVIWGDSKSEPGRGQSALLPGSDERTIDQVIATVSERAPSYMLVNLGDVDRFSHAFGPDSAEARTAIANVDRQLSRLIDSLRGLPSWSNTLIIITADHAIESTRAAGAARARTANFEHDLKQSGIQGLAVVTDGGVASAYLEAGPSPPKELSAGPAELLKDARAVALRDPGIAQALYRLPNPADPSPLGQLDTAHPDWKLSNPRIGELLLVAQKGTVLTRDANPFGIHGGPAERAISVAMFGGYRGLKAWSIDDTTVVNSPDLGMTARWLLGLREPRFVNGPPVPPDLCGRALKEAFAD